jgi:hypothetical protein
MYDYSKLKGKIIELYGTQGVFAHMIGRSQAYVSGVLNGRSYLEQRDIDIWAKALKIPGRELYSYFFTPIRQSLDHLC